MNFHDLPKVGVNYRPLDASIQDWRNARRPYYNVFPSATTLLTKVTLDLPTARLTPPINEFLVRFRHGDHPLAPAMCVLVSSVFSDDKQQRAIRIFMYYRRIRFGKPWADISHLQIVHNEDETVEEYVDKKAGKSGEHDKSLLRLIATLCLLADDPDVIEPDVLAADRTEFAETHNPKLVKKAHERGKIGWWIGRNLEVVPHYRRPHFAVRWTGEGRQVPKVVPIKGCIVKREAITRVPTGYLDPPIALSA